jgi:hypothetical protein
LFAGQDDQGRQWSSATGWSSQRQLLFLHTDTTRQNGEVDITSGDWHLLALRRRDGALDLLLDGAVVVGGVGVGARPHGTLRIGRPADKTLPGGRTGQFYGVISEAAVFRLALDDAELAQRASSVWRLHGDEPGLHAGWLLGEPPAPGMPSTLLRQVLVRGETQIVPVRPAQGNPWFPTPGLDLDELPLPEQEPWVCVQRTSFVSHNGGAAFCWDLALDNEDVRTALAAGLSSATVHNRAYPQGCVGAPITAAGAETVKRTSSAGENSFVETVRGDGLTGMYMHTRDDTNPPSGLVANAVTPGQALTTLRTHSNGAHLHLAVSNLPDRAGGFVTIPGAIRHYEIEGGGTWSYVQRGVPLQGDRIRKARPRPSTPTFTIDDLVVSGFSEIFGFPLPPFVYFTPLGAGGGPVRVTVRVRLGNEPAHDLMTSIGGTAVIWRDHPVPGNTRQGILWDGERGDWSRFGWANGTYRFLVIGRSAAGEIAEAEASAKIEWHGSRIGCIRQEARDDPRDRITHVGGTTDDGRHWELTVMEAVNELERGNELFVLDGSGRKAQVLARISPTGRHYLRTEPDPSELDNLLALPDCPGPARPWWLS